MTTSIPEVTTQAANWLVRLRCLDAPDALDAEFAEWLCQSPLHIEEYLHVVEIWEVLADRRVDQDVDIDTLVDQTHNDTVVPIMADRLAPTERKLPNSLPRTWIRVAGMAAGLAAAAIGGVALFRALADSTLRLHTELGESRVVVLQDHSIIQLNTATDVLVEFSGTERHVELARGEAMFAVSKDPQRPFVVYSGDILARAVGTKFSVSRRADGAVVTVAEGRVVVAEPRAPLVTEPGAVPSVEVTAGEQATAAAHGIVITKVSVEKVLAWRNGRLVFDDELVADVVKEFNRYSQTPLVITDPRVAQRRISGSFRINDPESLLAFLAASE